MRSSRLRSWLPALVLLLAACGGSGGGTVLGLATFSGDYFYIRARGTEGPPEETQVVQGSGIADGAGAVTVSGNGNDTGVIGVVAGEMFTYDVDPSGVMRFFSGPTVVRRGGIRADGSAALLGQVDPGSRPGFTALVRKGSGFSAAGVTGMYHGLNVGLFTGLGNSVSIVFVGTFDGAGNWSDTVVFGNVEGTLPAFVGSTGTYTVAPDGALTSTSGGTTSAGGIDSGRQYAILAGRDTAGSPALVSVLVPFSTTASVANLSGDYWMVAWWKSADPATAFTSLEGALEADGVGNFNFVCTSNVEGTAGVSAGSGTYGVGIDGTFSATLLGQDWRGAVSPNGAFAFLGGGTTVGSDPGAILLLRK